MQLFNTLTRSKQLLEPITPGQIKLYTCGPTVYHYAHIGNLRNVVFNDTLRRALQAHGYRVTHVMNITDVGHLVSDGDEGEDKLEKGAAREGKTVRQVAEYYTNAFHKHAEALNVLTPTRTINATDTIDVQIELVQILIDKGFAYQTEQAIYFDVTMLNDYGKLSGQKLGDKEVGARSEVVTDPNKHHPQDFALWFFTVGHFRDHEMRWDTSWGAGFPGWHLECSAIIHDALGEPIDIHTGGVDHIGTHHTNEIAQSEAAFDKPLAHIWMHNEFLLVDSNKMSKSQGGTYILPAILEQGYDPLALRLLYLQSHYRSQQNFTPEALDAAANLLERLQAWSYGRFQESATIMPDAEFDIAKQTILDALADDLGTPQAVASLIQLAGLYERQNRALSAGQMAWVDNVFGLDLGSAADISTGEKSVIAEREAAREAGDYAAADLARGKLKSQGIVVEDTAFGPRWSRTSKK